MPKGPARPRRRVDAPRARGYVPAMRSLRRALLPALLALAGCRAGAREGLPPAPPYGALVNQPTPPAQAAAPTPPEALPVLGRIEYYQISDG